MFNTYYQLAKPGIIYGNVVTATAGFMFASGRHLNVLLFILMLIGMALVIGSACVFNNIMDTGIDKKMPRTQKRPLATGQVNPKNALIYGIILGIIGFAVSYFLVNALSALVALIGFITYVAIYTPLKPRTTYAVLIGSISGATTPVIGYCAASGRFDLSAFIIFIILVLWQMPHFYAISLYRIDEYAAAGIPILPLQSGIVATKKQILYYIAAFTLASAALTVYGNAGYVYLILMLLACISWFYFGLKGGLTPENNKTWARKMFFYSLIVLVIFSAAIALNPWVGGIKKARALSMPTGTNDGIPAQLSAAFPDAPIMPAIAECESGMRQFNSDGTPLVGGGYYVGIFQISEGHTADAQSRGMDIYSIDGNIAYAKYMYQNQGTAPWKTCANIAANSIGGSAPSASANGSAATATTPHPAGTNILSNNTVYYVGTAGLTPYASAAVFQSYGFNSWANIYPANAEDLKLPITTKLMDFADGTLVQDSGTVYVMSGGYKYGISGAAIFTALGYSWNNLISADTSFVNAGAPINDATHPHLPGTLLNINGTIYYVTSNGIKAIPSMDVFNSWGFKINKIILPNQVDLANIQSPYTLVTTRNGNQLAPN